MRTALALSLLMFGCVIDASSSDDGAWSEPGKADDPTSGGVTPTHAAGVRLLDGFHALLDATAGRCVEPAATTPTYSVGAIEKPFELSFVSKKEDLARTLGIDVGLKIKYGAASIGPSASFLDSFKQKRSATHLLVAARASYRVTNQRAVKLTAEATEWLASDPRVFLHRCGNFFVNGVELEAQLFVMIRLEALTEDAARTINADLGLGAATGALGLDATVKAKLEQLAQREDVSVEMHVLDRGFLVDGGTTALISSLLGSGLSAATFEKIDGARNAMLASLNADACRDGGMGLETCPAERPGYDANMVRNAVPVKVDLRHYAQATNSPLGGPGSPYDTMRATVDRASRYLRTLSKLALRMETIVDDEIAVFLEAPSANKVGFGIAPPAPPVMRLDALATIAAQFGDRFDPDRDGSTAQGLDARISSCWSAALAGALEACTAPDDQPASTLPEAQEAEAAIADYVATGRIVPLVFAAKGKLGYNDANDACARDARRLPTFEEAQRLAIPIGYAELARTSEERLRFAAWHADRPKCGSQFPAFSNVPNGASGNLCTDDGFFSPHPTTTLCVPPGGPFDLLVAP